MRYTTRPLSDRTWLRPASQRERSRFTATWTETLNLLGREIDHLRGRDVVIECDIREQDLRLDGMIRSNARPPETPAVVVAFESKHGPMLYRSDRYGQKAWGAKTTHVWQENVRAIALTLEALRAVDRYGATETGQQYAGFKALPAGRAMPASHMTRDEALAVIARALNEADGPTVYPRDVESNIKAGLWHTQRRRLLRGAHPDQRAGNQTLWDQVEQAAAVLGVAR